MGGPMWWGRLMGRNGLEPFKGYGSSDPARRAEGEVRLAKSYIGGELHRMEEDYQEPEAVVRLARMAGITGREVQAVLRAVFTLPEPGCEACQKAAAWADAAGRPRRGRCAEHSFPR
jgi:hypothetical protein